VPDKLESRADVSPDPPEDEARWWERQVEPSLRFAPGENRLLTELLQGDSDGDMLLLRIVLLVDIFSDLVRIRGWRARAFVSFLSSYGFLASRVDRKGDVVYNKYLFLDGCQEREEGVDDGVNKTVSEPVW
jgi:hypothetical protein